VPLRRLRRYAWLSIAAALATILLKGAAWWWTDSVGLLSDALESFVNLAGAVMTLAMVTVAARPADDGHAFGHGKAEYFASGFEGMLILLAAVGIAVAALERLVHPRALEQIGSGLAISVVASAINFGVAGALLKAGRRHGSIALEADAHHLFTDVWTSGGVLLGVGAVALTGWSWLDPLLAIGVAANIVYTGIRLMSRSTAGLMDAALPEEQQQLITAILDRYCAQGLAFHAVRTRQAGSGAFVSMHLLVPGSWSVQSGHDWAEKIEDEIRQALPQANVLTHLEPLEDPKSLSDSDR